MQKLTFGKIELIDTGAKLRTSYNDATNDFAYTNISNEFTSPQIVNSTLAVDDRSHTEKFYVAGNAKITTNLTILGDGTIGGNLRLGGDVNTDFKVNGDVTAERYLCKNDAGAETSGTATVTGLVGYRDISTTAITSNSIIVLTPRENIGAKNFWVSNEDPAVGFRINCDFGTDADFYWALIN